MNPINELITYLRDWDGISNELKSDTTSYSIPQIARSILMTDSNADLTKTLESLRGRFSSDHELNTKITHLLELVQHEPARRAETPPAPEKFGRKSADPFDAASSESIDDWIPPSKSPTPFDDE